MDTMASLRIRDKGIRSPTWSEDLRGWSSDLLQATIVLLVLSFLMAACSSAAAMPTVAAFPTSSPRAENQEPSQETVSKGAELYLANCQSCHGDQDGQGTAGGASTHNQTGHTWHHPDAQLKDWILRGKLGFGLMPDFKGKLTEPEVDVILVFIKTWWTPDQRDSQSDISRRYQEALDK